MNYSFPINTRIDNFLVFFKLGFLLKIKNRIKTFKNLLKNSKKDVRFLEIGPGTVRIKGFETMNIIDSEIVDYIVDISLGITPFEENTFDLIYCSHLFEHIPWYMIDDVFKELNRILKSDGQLEIWVPDAYKICKVLVDYEETDLDNTSLDGWYRFNENKDPIKWAAGRIFTYGDGLGNLYHHNWHRGLFTEKYLKRVFSEAGFIKVEKMGNDQVRGYDHGWINLGVKGNKI